MSYWVIAAIILGIVVLVAFIFAYGRYIQSRQKLFKKTALFNNMEKLLQSMDTLIVITEIETDNIIFVNEKMKMDFGFTDDVIGEKCWKAFVKDGTERCKHCPKYDPDFISGKPVVWENHSPITNRYYRIISRFIDWPDGTTVFLEQCDDITELKESAANMLETDEYTHLLFDAMPMSCTLWDKNLKIINCNKAALNLFGVKDKEEFNERFADLSPEFQPNGENSIELAFTTIRETFEHKYFCVEWMHQLLNGEPLPCEVTLVRLKHKGEYLVAGYTRDLRKHKAYLDEINKAHENLRLARDAAEAANQAKSIFMANMSHEIRTPMNSIIGFSELAQDDDISPKTKKYLSNISESAEWLLQIINDILDISKIEAGKMELERIPFDLHDIFAHCQLEIMPKTMEKGIILYCYAEPSIGKKMLGDPLRLRQTLLNLLSNAVKFTNIGAVKLLASVKKTDSGSVTIHFEVKDSGIGMSPDQIEKIFEPFIQADDSITRRYGGTGLGLTITRNIISMMGGTLQVESAFGVGSKFSFELTFDIIDDDSDIPSPKTSFKDMEQPRFKGEVLVCDDNSMNQQVICEHLEKVGLQTVIAENGKVGVDIVAGRMQNGEKPFDLIFMDIHMPVMDGLEAASKITELGLKTPIVAVTANIMANDLELYRVSGIADFIGKPFTSQELWKCLVTYFSPVSFSIIDTHRQAIDNENLQKHLKAHFVKNNQTTYSHITKAIAAGDIRLAHRLAHTLKTNAGQIDEKRLQKAAATVEGMLSTGKNLLTEAQSRILETELQSVLEKLAVFSKANAPDSPKTLDDEKARELLVQLEHMLINRNPECIHLLDDIRAIPKAEELACLIEDYEFKQAIITLSGLKARFGVH
ncbi:MAG: ATP-binding protein [Treponema sp.]|nr:ATP-binding protein [Treponema sp.]